jgi:NAD(P)-dependent dehydrogenase (short-subunit alcohol dehydrogenase family)
MTHRAVAQGPDAAIDVQINIQAAENDPLRDEVEAYGRKLDEAGVDVAATRHTGRSKVAIVTGASSGIGLGVAKKLIEKGYRVVANSRKITSAMTLTSTADLKLVDGDIGIEETAKRVVSTAIQNFGTVDLLVNNAGVFIPKPFTEYTADDLRRVTQTNLAGFFYVSQLAVAQMRLQKFGHVVNISTSLVSQPIAGVPGSLSNLTKAGLESVTRALAIEFAAEGIRFNAIAPGVVNTPMNPVEAHEFLRQLSPLKRLAEVGEVADLLLYLESAQFVNGEVVHLDGGAHAGKW